MKFQYVLNLHEFALHTENSHQKFECIILNCFFKMFLIGIKLGYVFNVGRINLCPKNGYCIVHSFLQSYLKCLSKM